MFSLSKKRVYNAFLSCTYLSNYVERKAILSLDNSFYTRLLDAMFYELIFGKPIHLKVHKHELILNFFGPKSKPCMTLVNIRQKFRIFRFLSEFRSSNIFAVAEHTRNQFFVVRYQTNLSTGTSCSCALDFFRVRHSLATVY